MSFIESIDFSKYGINFECSPDTVSVPKSIRENIIPAIVLKDNSVKFTKQDGTDIIMIFKEQKSAGSFGTVWETLTEIDKGVPLIVKTINLSWLRTAKFIRNVSDIIDYEYDIIQEAIMNIIVYEATKNIKLPDISLNGPFAPKLFLIGKNSDNFYIVSEKLDETTLNFFDWGTIIAKADIIRTSILQLSKILEILYDKLKFNHRDLKPDNLMYKIIDGRINIRLIDFGFSCLKYRNLIVGGINKWTVASSLHCNSKIRDMHSYLYYIIKFLAFRHCPLFTLISVLITTNDLDSSEWKYTYKKFNASNTEGNRKAALNCTYDVVYNIFYSLTFESDKACSKIINTDWTKHLVSININNVGLLTNEEYKNIKPELRKEFQQNYERDFLKTIWNNSSLYGMFITEFKYKISNMSDIYIIGDKNKIPLLFDTFISKPDALLSTDNINETILHKIIRNKNIPDADIYFDKALTAIITVQQKNKNITDRAVSNIINIKSQKTQQTAYDMAIDNDYKYAQNKLIMYIDFNTLKNIDLNMLDTFLEPDNNCLKVNSGAISYILFYIIMKNNKEYNERLDKFLAKINIKSLRKIEYNEPSFHTFDYNRDEEKTYIVKYPNRSRYDLNYFINYSPIDSAIHYNNVYVIKKLLPYDLTVNKKSFLFNISYLDDEEVITLLLNKYKDVELYINDNIYEYHVNPLTFAVKQNNLLVVKKLVDIPNIKFSANSGSTQLTCLHWASIKASRLNGKEKETALEIIKVLLKKYPALADIKDNDNMDPANPYYAKSSDVRRLIKSHKSWLFKKNPNTEKNVRNTRRGGKRKTQKRR